MAAITIQSQTGGHYAVLDDANADDGVLVSVYQRAAPRSVSLLRQWVLDCPWHRACDAVHDIIWPLPDATARHVYYQELGRVIRHG